MSNWHERYNAMKVGMGLTNADVAELTGNTHDSIKNSTQPKKEFPRLLRMAIVVYEIYN